MAGKNTSNEDVVEDVEQNPAPNPAPKKQALPDPFVNSTFADRAKAAGRDKRVDTADKK